MKFLVTPRSFPQVLAKVQELGDDVSLRNLNLPEIPLQSKDGMGFSIALVFVIDIYKFN